MRRSRLALASLAGIGLAACVTTQTVQVQLAVAPASAQWQGAWSGSMGGGVTALPGGGFTFPAGQILAPDGTEAAPAYSFVGYNTGFYRVGGSILIATGGTATPVSFNYNAGGEIKVVTTGRLVWSNSSGSAVSAQDLALYRNAAGILALRGASPTAGASVNFVAITAPATPAAGTGILYYSSVDKKFHQINDAGLDTALW